MSRDARNLRDERKGIEASHVIELIDLQAQRRRIQKNLDLRLNTVFNHGAFIMGPEVKDLEEKLAAFVGVKHCIAVGNGTDALMIALMALGVGPGDEVITTSFSFVATAETIAILGAKPVFAEINPATFNLDIASVESLVTSKTKAIIPVSLFGQCADYAEINAIAKKHEVHVIEDAAQSFGAKYRGRRSGSLTEIACTSFFPSKPLGCYGDGGACFTDQDHLAKAMREIRSHGQDRRYHHPILGVNSRLDTLQAAVLLAKLEIFESELDTKQKIAEFFNQELSQAVITPHVETWNQSAYAQYTIQSPKRDALAAALKKLGISTAVHYPIPLHRQPAFQKYHQGRNPLTVSEKIANEVLSIPMHPYLSRDDQVAIVEAIRHFEL